MADTKLSAEAAASALSGPELIRGVQSAADVKITATQIKTFTSASPTLVTPVLGTPSSGVATNLTGTAAGLTAGNVTTNANLTGPITSVGNATAVASQTGTGSKFVMDTSPTLVTPNIGAATGSGILTLQSGLRRNVRVVTAAGAITDATSDDIIVVNKSSPATTTVNLAAGVTGQMKTIKDGAGNSFTYPITITPASGNIDGQPTLVINSNYASVDLVYNGTEWNQI